MQWTDQAYKFELNNSTSTGYSAKRLDIPSTLVEETSHTAQVHEKSPPRPKQQHTTWIRDQAKPCLGRNVTTDLLKAQGYGPRWRDCWVPKSSYKQSSKFQTPLRQNQNQQPYPPTKQKAEYKWVPKNQSSPSATSNPHNRRQAEYQWVPKSKPSSSVLPNTSFKPVEKPTNASTSTRQPQPTKIVLQVWRSKPLSHKLPLRSTKLLEIHSKNKPTSSLTHQPISKAINNSMEISIATGTASTSAPIARNNP